MRIYCTPEGTRTWYLQDKVLPDFDVLLAVHLSIILIINNLMHNLFYNKFIICLYMFRALLCSSSGGQNCIIQHLVSSHTVGGRPVHWKATYRCDTPHTH